MQSDNTQPVFLIPGNFGLVEDFFDPTAQPQRANRKGSLHTGGLFLRATLQEMLQILRLCEELDRNHATLLKETKAQYDNLEREKRELELLEKRRSIFKPFKLVSIRRAKRTFLESTQELWVSTRTTSDTLKRAVLSVPSTAVAKVEDESLEGDEVIAGVVADSEGALATAQRLVSALEHHRSPSSNGIPAIDPRSSVSTSSSSPISASCFSPLSVHVHHTYNIVNNTNSNAPGLTITNDSENASGSTIEHVNSPLPS